MPEELKKIPAGSVDLVFADPPYNLQLAGNLTRPDQSKVDAVDDDWDKFASFADLRPLHARRWLAECRRVLKPDGALWVIGSYHNIFRVGSILQDLGFWILNDVVWRKTNPMPNFRGRRFTNAHETLIWAARSAEVEIHLPLRGHEGVQRRPADALRLDPAAVHRRRAAEERQRATSCTPRRSRRPCCIASCSSSTNPGDVVLDPFFGTGTTGAAAKQLGRIFIGIEREEDYAEAALARIDATEAAAARVAESDGGQARRAAHPLRHAARARPGEGRRNALRSDPAHRGAGARRRLHRLHATRQGSIHKIGAHVQGAEACNGWTFWHVRKGANLVPIDVLRQQVRAEMAAACMGGVGGYACQRSRP